MPVLNPFPGRRRSIVKARTQPSPPQIPIGDPRLIPGLHKRSEKGRCPRCNRYIGKGVNGHLKYCKEVKHVNVW